VIIQEESYTSVANFLNLDPLPVYGQTTEKPVFSGKRIKRGLYRTDKGILVQSDVMGSYNILRKAFPNAFNRYGIERFLKWNSVCLYLTILLLTRDC